MDWYKKTSAHSLIIEFEQRHHKKQVVLKRFANSIWWNGSGRRTSDGATTSIEHQIKCCGCCCCCCLLFIFSSKNCIHGHDFSQWLPSPGTCIVCACVCAWPFVCRKQLYCITIDVRHHWATMAFSAHSFVRLYIGKCWRTSCNEGNTIDIHFYCIHAALQTNTELCTKKLHIFLPAFCTYNKLHHSVELCRGAYIYLFNATRMHRRYRWRQILFVVNSIRCLFFIQFSVHFQQFSNRKIRCKLIIKVLVAKNP